MNLKTFRGRSMRRVLAEVRATMGAEALIVSTRKLGGRTATFEVVAALDTERPEVSPGARPLRPSGATGSHAGRDLGRIGELADVLEATDPVAIESTGEELIQRLLASDVRWSVAHELLEQARASADGDTAGVLRQLIGLRLGARWPQPAGRPRTIALVGPTGVGKTTTAAKLAARLGAGLDGRVGLIAADPYRVGAVDQLAVYADLLGVPFRTAERPEEIASSARSIADVDWIVIDTQGRSPREAQAADGWTEVLRDSRTIEPLLVLAANTRDADLDAAVEAFWAVRPRALVFTKIDETRRLGALLNQSTQTRLPVWFVTNGQQVPDDLLHMSPETMTEMLLAGGATA